MKLENEYKNKVSVEIINISNFKLNKKLMLLTFDFFNVKLY